MVKEPTRILIHGAELHRCDGQSGKRIDGIQALTVAFATFENGAMHTLIDREAPGDEKCQR